MVRQMADIIDLAQERARRNLCDYIKELRQRQMQPTLSLDYGDVAGKFCEQEADIVYFQAELETMPANVCDILNRTRAAGVSIRTDSVDLMLEAARRPPDEIIEALSSHKAEIIALLRPPVDISFEKTDTD